MAAVLPPPVRQRAPAIAAECAGRAGGDRRTAKPGLARRERGLAKCKRLASKVEPTNGAHAGRWPPPALLEIRSQTQPGRLGPQLPSTQGWGCAHP